MRISAVFALFLLLTVAASSQSPMPPDLAAAQDTSSADSLLLRVRGTLTLFPPAERATLLIHLAGAQTGGGNSGTEHSNQEQWVEDIFQLTRQMRPGVERMDDEATALIALSRTDSALALDLLPRIELPSSPGNAYEFREKAASQVFRKFIDDHPRDIDRVTATARQMGELGIYPFRAAAAVIRHIGKRDPEHAAEMAADAADFYHRAPRMQFFNFEYAGLMADLAKSAPHSISRDDLQFLVANALNAHMQPEDLGNSVSVRTFNEAFLAGLLPAVHAVDPRWEARLKEEHPALESRKFRKNAKLIEASWAGATDPEEELSDRTTPHSALDEIRHLSPADVHQALRIRDEIHDPAWRAVAGADIAVLINRTDPEFAHKLLADAERQLKHTRDPQNKLRISAALGRAYLQLGRRDAFATIISRMFRLADETFSLFSRESPKCSWAALPGARELIPLTREAAGFDPQMMLQKIDGVQTPLLQTHLLISMVEGLQDAQGRGVGRE